MEKEDVTRYYSQLVNSLKVLCMNDAGYETYLPDFTDKPFEVMDGFRKAFDLMPQIVEAGKLENPVIAAVLSLNNYLDWLSDKKEYQALPDSDFFALAEWKRAKELALEALGKMSESPDNPDLRFI